MTVTGESDGEEPLLDYYQATMYEFVILYLHAVHQHN